MSSDNYYELLGVSPSASDGQIKAGYRKLAKVLHPDVAPENSSPKVRDRFDKIQKAYQTLMDPQLRKAYDAGGAKFADATRENAASGQGHQQGINVILKGSPMEVMQRVFGGTPLEQLIVGPLYRSMWHLRAQGATRLNLHSYEVVETLRMLRLSTFLVGVLDTYAMSDEALCLFVKEELASIAPHLAEKLNKATATTSAAQQQQQQQKRNPFSGPSGGGSSSAHLPRSNKKPAPKATSSSTSSSNSSKKPTEKGLTKISLPSQIDSEATPSLDAFSMRANTFARRLARCCFGKEMIHEAGQCYVVNAQRFLGEEPFWKPRLMVTVKMSTGLGRMKRALTGTVDPNDPTKVLSAGDAMHFFAIEFENVVANVWMVLRFTCITAAQDLPIQSVREALLSSPKERKDPDGSHVVSPLILSQRLGTGDKKQQQQAQKPGGNKPALVVQPRPPTSAHMKQALAIVHELPAQEREQLVEKVAHRVKKARSVALKELGRVFCATGRPWTEPTLQQCIDEIRGAGTSRSNLEMPPPF